MSWLGDTIKKFAPVIGTVAGGILGGPLGASVGATVGGMVGGGSDSASRDGAKFGAQADQYYNNAIDYNAQALNIADERRGAMQSELDSLRNRADTIYDPMERQLAAEVSGPADLESAASTARNEFTGNFDQAANSTRRQLLQLGVRPNAATAARMERNSAYDRARGATAAANQARTEEDDQHFMRLSTFYAQNGSGIREQLRSGLSDMYGADYAARSNAAQFSQAQGDRYQGYSNSANAQAGNQTNALTSIAGTVGAAYFGGAFNKQQPNAQGAHGSAAAVTNS